MRSVLLLCALACALTVTVAPATAASAIPDNVKLCKDWRVDSEDGFSTLPVFVRSDGSTFASHADCVTYAAQGGTVIRRSQFVCESFGGRFIWENLAQTASGLALWTCRNFTVIGSPLNVLDNFSAPCLADIAAAGLEGISITWTVIDVGGSGNVMECRGFAA